MRSLSFLGDVKLKWYRYLYLGDNARKAKYKTFGLIRKSRFTIDTYIVAISVNPDNILDVYSANMLKQPHFKNKSYRDKVYVVGLARGRDEDVYKRQVWDHGLDMDYVRVCLIRYL